MKSLKHFVISAFVLLGLGGTLLVPVQATASQAENNLCRGAGGTPTEGGGCTNPNETRTVRGTIDDIINLLLFLIGVIAVIMIIIGGLRYVLSGGDQSSVSSAKNTIIYAVVGLIVAAMAYAIINFVLDAI